MHGRPAAFSQDATDHKLSALAALPLVGVVVEYARTRARTRTRTHTHVHTRTHAHVHTRMHARKCMHTRTHARTLADT